MRKLAVAVGAVLVLTLWPTAVLASNLGPDQQGWWSEVQQAPTPLPVNTVTGKNLMVGNDPANGPNAVAAVRFTVPANIDGAIVDASTVPAVLTLHVAPNTAVGKPAVVACTVQANWQPVEGGSWADKPTWSCNPAAPAKFTAAGDAASFDLTPALQRSAGLYDLAIVPEPGKTDPFSVQFLPAGSDSLALGAGTPTGTSSESVPIDAGAGAVPLVPDTAATVPDFGTSGTFSTPALPSVPSPVATPVTPPASASNPRFFRAPLRKVVTKRSQQAVALGLLAAIGLGLWWFGGQQARSPRLLGSLGEGAPPPDAGLYVPSGGIGRFARPRSRPPTRL